MEIVLSLSLKRGVPCGVMSNVVDFEIVLSGFDQFSLLSDKYPWVIYELPYSTRLRLK